jgi:ribonuclease BN (tRNA processing enzyme)
MSETTRIHFLGTGTAFNTDGRACQSILLQGAGSGDALLDAGPDVGRSVAAHGIDVERVDTLFLTHLHGDHVAGWPFLLLHWILVHRRRRRLDVVGPAGTRETLEGLARLCYGELAERGEFEVAYLELPVGEASSGLEAGGIAFATVPMAHHPTSLGYRLEWSGRRLALSGDTAWCDGLVRLVDGVDVAIVECSGLRPFAEPHLSLEEIRGRRERLATPRLVLVHLDDAVAGALAADPLPGTLAAFDGMTLDV